jgi:hypothetical protein
MEQHLKNHDSSDDLSIEDINFDKQTKFNLDDYK